MCEVENAYNGSDAAATIAVYKRLEAAGPRGIIAMNLLRACKASERAKMYRGGNSRGSYKRQAYDKKDWSLMQLTQALTAHAVREGIIWGWGWDAKAIEFENVIYIDLPEFGQVSFHHRCRQPGPDYAKEWDGVRGLGSSRIIRFACAVLGDPQPAETKGEKDAKRQTRRQRSASARAEDEAIRAEERQDGFDL